MNLFYVCILKNEIRLVRLETVICQNIFKINKERNGLLNTLLRQVSLALKKAVLKLKQHTLNVSDKTK